MRQFEIKFEDLNYGAQMDLLNFLGITHPEEAGYDRQPVAIVVIDEPQNVVIEETVIYNNDY